MATTDTIAAIATPPGRGGVGIVRISGPLSITISNRITGAIPAPRQASFKRFFINHSDAPDGLIDFGLVLFFPAPHSFTGEDIIELHGHGGAVVMDRLLQAVLAAGARMASPGEFSERAFLNDKLDLAQAEAIADLIDSATEDAARSALISLSGQFSTEVFELVESITRIRVFIEAALDFSDEDIDFLADDALLHSLEQSQQQLQRIVQRADSGRLLREGATVVIAGKPNAGKSSLLNYLTGHEAAIVTDMPGTTRDILKEHINLDGIPVHLLDTAGLRQSDHRVEQEGIRRANQAIASADLVLLVVDSTEIHPGEDLLTLWQRIGISAPPSKWCVVFNKTDLSGLSSGFINDSAVAISTKHAEGMSDLKKMITSSLGFSTDIKNPILARRRHLDALRRAQDHLNSAISQLKQSLAGELVAEDLKECQKTLGEITGTVYSDELLGRIFSSFCIGK